MRFIQYLFVTLFLIISGFCSCRSSKKVTDYQGEERVSIRDSARYHQSDFQKVEELLDGRVNLSEDLQLSFLVFSPPDSAGRQFVTAKGQLKRKTDKGEQYSQHTKKDSTVETEASHHKFSDAVVKEDLKKENSKFLWWKIISLLIALIIIIYTLNSWRH